MRYDVEFYRTEDKSCPVIEFLDSLNIKMRTKVLRMVHLLEQNGNELREPYSKHLEDGIFELRMELGSDITRVLYFFVVDKKVVLTHGFVKKTQKTPKAQIELAKKIPEDIFGKEQMPMITFRDSLNKRMESENFRKEYEDIQPEMDIIRAIVKARKEQQITQAELAARTGINQGDISRLERGTRNPSLNMLKKLASGLGMQLKIEFLPKASQI